MMALVEEAVEVHGENCRCTVCGCRRWLNFRAADQESPPTLKIATYGGTGGGTGEPDRAYDRVVSEVDLEVALACVPDDFVRLVGGLNRNLQSEHPWRHGEDPRRSPVPVMRWLERFRYQDWLEACLVDAPGGWRTERDLLRANGHATLRRLLDQCACEMAVNLGERVEGMVRTTARRRVMPVPWEPEGEPEA